MPDRLQTGDDAVTAFVLGELSEADRRLIEIAANQSPALRGDIETLREVVSLVTAALTAEPGLSLAPAQRDAIRLAATMPRSPALATVAAALPRLSRRSRFPGRAARGAIVIASLTLIASALLFTTARDPASPPIAEAEIDVYNLWAISDAPRLAEREIPHSGRDASRQLELAFQLAGELPQPVQFDPGCGLHYVAAAGNPQQRYYVTRVSNSAATPPHDGARGRKASGESPDLAGKSDVAAVIAGAPIDTYWSMSPQSFEVSDQNGDALFLAPFDDSKRRLHRLQVAPTNTPAPHPDHSSQVAWRCYGNTGSLALNGTFNFVSGQADQGMVAGFAIVSVPELERPRRDTLRRDVAGVELQMSRPDDVSTRGEPLPPESAGTATSLSRSGREAEFDAAETSEGRGVTQRYGARDEYYGRALSKESSLFVCPVTAPLSSFSLDVGEDSIAPLRESLAAGQWPPPEMVRTEELLNYYAYDADRAHRTGESAPTPAEQRVSIFAEACTCPWHDRNWLAQITLVSDVPDSRRNPLAGRPDTATPPAPVAAPAPATSPPELQIEVDFNAINVWGYRLVGYEHAPVIASPPAANSTPESQQLRRRSLIVLYEVAPRSVAAPAESAHLGRAVDERAARFRLLRVQPLALRCENRTVVIGGLVPNEADKQEVGRTVDLLYNGRPSRASLLVSNQLQVASAGTRAPAQAESLDGVSAPAPASTLASPGIPLDDLLTVRVLFRTGPSAAPQLAEFPLLPPSSPPSPSPRLAWSSAVAAFGHLLREPSAAGTITCGDVLTRLESLSENAPGERRGEFLQLVQEAQQILAKPAP